MNLVEQQEKARALPMQYLQQAANGQSVELAPWIATAELQRRTTADQHLQAAKGPQGSQPTVKDQLEQKAGLMATQAAQQAQAAQAQQSSPPPGPIPGGIPEPEPQPEEPVMAAHGGLMNAPVSFHFAHGGILGYAGDEPQGSRVRSRLPNESFEQYRQRLIALDAADQDRADAEARAQQDVERKQEIARRQAAGQMLPRSPFLGAPTDVVAPAPSVSAAARRDDRAPRPSLQGQGIRDALPKPPPPAPRPRVAPTQEQEPTPAPAQPMTAQAQPMTAPAQMDPAGLAALEYATKPAPARTQQDAINDMRALRKESGADQPIGINEAAQQAALDAAQKRQQDQAEKLAWAAYVQGTVGTPGSASLAYQQTMANALGNEADYGQRKYKNIADLEAARRGLTKEYQTSLESTTAADRLAAAAAAKDRATTGANLFNAAEQTRANIYGTNKQFDASKYSADKHAESAMAIAKLQERAANARHDSSERRLALQELTQREASYDNDIKTIVTQMRPLVGSFKPEDRAELKTLTDQLNVARDLKARVRTNTGAAPADVKITPTQAAALAKYGAK